jgi:hypothetical protein
MFKIILVGAGQIGSRYLSGLAKISQKIKIFVVDPNIKSKNICRQRWIDACGDKSFHKIEFLSDLSFQNTKMDLAIIATSSLNRSSLIQDIALKFNPQYWVLEKILAQSIRDLDLIKYATAKAKNVWVNTPRRLMMWHQKLKKKFIGQGPLNVKKVGGSWGLACNAIHFIDLVSWWTEESLLSIDNTRLDKKWFESKRSGYFDVTGELYAEFSGGTKLILRSDLYAEEDIMHVKLFNNSLWVINEEKGMASNFGVESLDGFVEYQSNITAPMVTKILMHGKCDLPSLEESSKQHAIFIEAMLGHWRYFVNPEDKVVPIT